MPLNFPMSMLKLGSQNGECSVLIYDWYLCEALSENIISPCFTFSIILSIFMWFACFMSLLLLQWVGGGIFSLSQCVCVCVCPRVNRFSNHTHLFKCFEWTIRHQVDNNKLWRTAKKPRYCNRCLCTYFVILYFPLERTRDTHFSRIKAYIV